MDNYISCEFTELELDENEFDNLVCMGAPPMWEKYHEEHEFLLTLCHRPLKEVVQIVRDAGIVENPHKKPQNATEVFKRLCDKNIKSKDMATPWFRQHKLLSENFHEELMGKIWIRNLSCYRGGERDKCPDGSFYIEDGNHRTLVYAMIVALSEETYEPIKALHATSWDIADGILGYTCHSAQGLEHNGKIPSNGGVSVKNRIRSYKNGFHAPIKLFESF